MFCLTYVAFAVTSNAFEAYSQSSGAATNQLRFCHKHLSDNNDHKERHYRTERYDDVGGYVSGFSTNRSICKNGIIALNNIYLLFGREAAMCVRIHT